MKEAMLEVVTREISTRHNLKSLRTQGMIPAIFYGHDEKNISMAIDARKFDLMIHSGIGSHALVSLKVGDVTKTAIIKEIQRDVISQKPIHIDFLAVSLKEQIVVKVALHVVGTAPGVKLGGGILEHILREVEVRCLPQNIPQAIDVDVSNLEINQALAVRDLPKTEGIEILHDSSAIIINIVAPTILEEAPAAATVEGAAAGTAAEPEVISKGKKEKEGEEGAAPEAGKAPAGKAPEGKK
jgi:large subunit ribosomal protein L25